MNMPEGHRERLRLKFRQSPNTLSDTEFLELLLTYAIPRRDVSLLASDLIFRFGSLSSILSASDQDLMQTDGIGESAVTFLRLLDFLVKEMHNPMIETSSKQVESSPQLKSV